MLSWKFPPNDHGRAMIPIEIQQPLLTKPMLS